REVGGVEVPLVGRDLELRHLVESISRVREESRVHAALVWGPPGIGKSRLRHELQRRIEASPHDYICLEGRGEAARARASHAAIQGLLRGRAGIPEGTSPAEARARIEGLVRSAAVPDKKTRGTMDFLGELLGVPFAD